MSDLGDDNNDVGGLFQPAQPYEERRRANPFQSFAQRRAPTEDDVASVTETSAASEYGYGSEYGSDVSDTPKPFYRRWQFWLPLLCLVVLVIYAFYSYTDYNRHRNDLREKYNLVGRIKNIKTINTLEHGHIANDEDGMHASDSIRFM